VNKLALATAHQPTKAQFARLFFFTDHSSAHFVRNQPNLCVSDRLFPKPFRTFVPLNLLNLPPIGFFTALEWLAAALGLLSVVGNLKLLRWGWLAQAASGLGYGIVFFHQNLVGLAVVQIYFIGVALWAWGLWAKNASQNAAKIVSLTFTQSVSLIVAWGLATVLVGWVLTKVGEQNTAYVDAFTTVGSVIAQWLMARYRLQTWHVWFAVNLVSVGLFFHSGLFPTSVLYALFTVLAFIGVRQWKTPLR
jgi:nicotinamide mononucleotide transporter